MSLQKIPLAGFSYKGTETSETLIPVTGSGTPTPNANGILTYTTTGAHSLQAGDSVTFTGTTPAGYNTTTFVVLSVPSTTTFTVASSLGQVTVAGSVVPVRFPAAGLWFATTGANAVWQYNPDNTGYTAVNPIPSGTNVGTPPTATVVASVAQSAAGATWRTIIPASSQGTVYCDGYNVRIAFSGTAATSTRAILE